MRVFPWPARSPRPIAYPNSRLFSRQMRCAGWRQCRPRRNRTAEPDRNHRCELSVGVDVIFNHHLKAERRMMKECDQQQDHETRRERRPQPADKGRIVGAGMGDDRGDEPQAQRDERDGREAFRKPVPGALFGRAEPDGASQGRAEGSALHQRHPAINRLVTQAPTVSATLAPTTAHLEM